MTKTAFYYQLGYQMAKIAKKKEGYRYDYGEELKHQLPFWLGGALGLGFARKPAPTPGSIAQAAGLGALSAAISAVPMPGITTETGVMPFVGESAMNALGVSFLDHLIRGGPTTPQRMLGAAAAGAGLTAASRALRKKEKRWF